MNISSLVEALEAIKEKHGDLPVYFWNDWSDFPVERVEYHEADLHGETYPGTIRPERVVIDDGQSA